MLEKASAVLDLFTEAHPELGAPEIAARLRRPRSTVYRLLGRMAEAGFLDQDEATGRFRPGMRLALLGEVARQSTSLQRQAHPALVAVSEATGEMTSLMVPSQGEGVTVDVVESYHPVKIPGHLGGRFPLHATAGGKVMLAWLPREEQRRLLGPRLERWTAATLTRVEDLLAELDGVRRAGHAVARGEWVEDVFAVAAPVRDHRGRVAAAIGVSCPRSRWRQPHVRALVEAVLRGGADATRALGGRG